MWEGIIFYGCGSLMLLAAIMMVLSRNAVVAACWLIFCFLNTAGIFAVLSAPFLAVLQVLVYAGAIMVLFLFVIMMLQTPVLPEEKQRGNHWIWPVILLPPAATAMVMISWIRTPVTMIPAQPLRRPITLYPSLSALMVIARIAGFSPGTSPPPVRMAMVPFVFFTFAILIYT